jgi:hypothetical protein
MAVMAIKTMSLTGMKKDKTAISMRTASEEKKATLHSLPKKRIPSQT